MARHHRLGTTARLAGRGILLGLLTAHASWVRAGPGLCAPTTPASTTEVTCTGNQADGIKSGVDFVTPPVTTVHVTTSVLPTTATSPGIVFRNQSGANATLTSTGTVTTSGNEATGLRLEALGTPLGTSTFFGLVLPSGTGGSAGKAAVTNSGAITTDGESAHGLVAKSRAGGFPDAVVEFLSKLAATDNTPFKVVAVEGIAGNVGKSVAGDKGGSFVLNADGTYTPTISGEPFTSLKVGESIVTSVSYRVSYDGTNDLDSNATLAMKVTKLVDGTLKLEPGTTFDVYGPSKNAAISLKPDLVAYNKMILKDAAVGGSAETVHVINTGRIETRGQASIGLLAESKGGQGNAGGLGVVSGSTGNTGGTAGAVTVDNRGAIVTDGGGSHGIVARSVGGNGGRGGDAVLFGVGGSGGSGGASGAVTVINSGAITTARDFAIGIFAQSLTGGAGSGGEGGFLGGAGGGGGAVPVAGAVGISNTATINTGGDGSHGILAQSLGGAGGAGGMATGIVAFGGDASSAGHGGQSSINNTGAITAHGIDAHGLVAQSIGGGGGSAGPGYGLGAVGGVGSAGGNGGQVGIVNSGELTADGTRGRGIVAQSVGGGGGDGGGAAGLVGIGGKASTTSDGGIVGVSNSGKITATENAILAQSIGGGGGSGGFSGGLVSIGGNGAGGGSGAAVGVSNTGSLTTAGVNGSAIFAQSLGGGGGSGGFSGSVGAFASVAIGGSGGRGGNGSTVTVSNGTGTIVTGAGWESENAGTLGGVNRCGVDEPGKTPPHAACGDGGKGIFAQSLGGGGGSGGFAAAVSVGKGFSGSLAIGGSGGAAGNADTVNVQSLGNITTHGINAEGIFAQSLGGGGGNGGFAVAASGSTGLAVAASVGGSGGAGGNGGAVRVGAPTTLIGGRIETFGDSSAGILAQSVGGGGGTGGFSVAGTVGRFDVSFAMGGQGGAGGTGGSVGVQSAATVVTHGYLSNGITAQSIGGGGGAGGFSVAGALSVGGASSGSVALSLGGGGGVGNTADKVDLTNTGSITTAGISAHGILAQSVGGGGGAGGFAGSLALSFSKPKDDGKSLAVAAAVGGSGGNGNNAAKTTVFNSGTITTTGADSIGIKAESLGGGGGSGGFGLSVTAGSGEKSGNVGVAIGGCLFSGIADGQDCAGGKGGKVEVTNTGTITTSGLRSHGIAAKSVGGGGGDGGFAIAGTLGKAVLKTCPSGQKCDQKALNAQVSVGIGGHGGAGSESDNVLVTHTGTITTTGDEAAGIRAQSVGGGGGDGGFSIAGAIGGGSSKDIAVSVGGWGGRGGAAGNVEARADGAITTSGARAVGIYADSVGGGGGDGGFTGTLALGLQGKAPTNAGSGLTMAFNLGGAGGDGAIGGTVNVSGKGAITTAGDSAYGIFAHSIGGGGGNGGTSLALMFGVDALKDRKTYGFDVSLGGAGGNGSDGGTVNVTRSGGDIKTTGDNAAGIVAQSVGHGGGIGGNANSFNLFKVQKDGGADFHVAVSVGGDGGGAGKGGTVTVSNAGNITTGGRFAAGIYAQSVGGGGGAGGNGAFGFGGVIPNETAEKIADGVDILADVAEIGAYLYRASQEKKSKLTAFAKDYLTDWDVNVGGSGGASGSGDKVSVTNTGKIVTTGDYSMGVFAQSVGGGGGQGGAGNAGLTGKIAVAGGAGSTGNGGEVIVTQTGDIDTGRVDEKTGEITGDRAHGIYAQSIGGGGGMSGDVSGFAKSLGLNVGLTLAFGRDGSNSGNGSKVTVTQAGNITTRGEGAIGILATSVGGGGGDLGDLCNNPLKLADGGCPTPGGNAGSTGNNPLGISGGGGGGGNGGKVTVDNTGTIHTYGVESHGVFAQSVGGGGGKAGGFWGSIGGAGAADTVTVNQTGNIITEGAGAHGILAQSRAGTGDNTSGAVSVTLKGSITASGVNADGIQAQSAGGGTLEVPVFAPGIAKPIFHALQTFTSHNAAITINVQEGGSVSGAGPTAGTSGFGGVGVRMIDGALDGDANLTPNVLNNAGTVTTAAGVKGWAIVAGVGRDTINNAGTVTGSIDLGSGTNVFDNKSTGTLNAGASINVGAGNALSNSGSVAPGGKGTVTTSTLAGNFVQQLSGGVDVEIDTRRGTADRLNVTGTANVAGNIRPSVFEPGYVTPGTRQYTVLTSAGALAADGLGLVAPSSAVANYSLIKPNANEIAVGLTVDFRAPGGLAANQTAIGEYVNRIQAAGGSTEFAPIAAALVALPDARGLAAAYDRLSPGPHLSTAAASVNAQHNFANALMSCRVRDGENRFVREGECSWMRLSNRTLDREREPGALGFREDAIGLAGGMQRAIGANWHAGFGVSYEDSTLRVADGLGSSYGERFQAGAILKRSFGATTISGAVSVAQGRYTTLRLVDLPVTGAIARGTERTTVAAAQARAAHAFEQGNWYLKPMIDFGAGIIRTGGFAENGAGAANLHVATSERTYLSVRPGLELGGEWVLRSGAVLRPFVQAGVMRYFGPDARMVASFEGAPVGTGAFEVNGGMERTVTEAAIGVDLIAAKGINVRLGYFGEYSRRVMGRGVSIKLGIAF